MVDEKKLQLCLDDVAEDSFIYTKYDIGGQGHYITILEKDKEAFLDEYIRLVREQISEKLYIVEEEEEDGW